MGGNVTIGTETADKIDLTKMRKYDLSVDLVDFVKEFEQKFEVALSPSGSTAFLFDETITEDELALFKPHFGDLDFQIDENKMPELLPLQKIGQFQLIGTKKTTNTVVTLWKYRGMNIQIDLEGVEFKGEYPTEWSRFAYHASWVDQLSYIKGVAHKYIFRALTSRWLDEYQIVKAKGGYKTVKTSIFAFSNKGLRRKLVPTDYGNYYELKTSESVYYTDLELIFNTLIDSHANYGEREKLAMWSFTGVLRLITHYIDKSEWDGIADGMANLLWGSGAQKIYADAWEDRVHKSRIMLHMATSLNIDFGRWDILQNKYYGVL